MDKAIYLRSINLEKEFIDAYGPHSLRTGLFQKSFGKFYRECRKIFHSIDSKMILVSIIARATLGMHTSDIACSAYIFIENLSRFSSNF